MTHQEPLTTAAGKPPESTASDATTPLAADLEPEHKPEPRQLRELLAEGEALFVDDAGLVILAPYLPAYFGKLGWVQERRFVSTEARERAVLLLRYLATGTAEASEHLVALDKLLCGWPLAEPVARTIELSPTEEEESDQLLASVAEHWTALGRTSVDGLRGSFLAREGQLTDNEPGWRLVVQRTGYDVLLDQLPWAIGMVVLPWMERPLFVEW